MSISKKTLHGFEFSKSKKILKELGVTLEQGKGRIITKQPIDFTLGDIHNAVRSGTLIFGEDGIYVTYEGRKYRGYIYIRVADVQRYGLPKYHLLKCKTIFEMMNNQKYDRYTWSCLDYVTITDRYTDKVYEKVELFLCKNCLSENGNLSSVDSTTKFFELLKQSGLVDDEQVSPGDYHTWWYKISELTREKRGWKCESCGFFTENPLHKRFLHVHHKNGNKADNEELNLQVLCIRCHAKVDKNHSEKISKAELDTFNQLYPPKSR